MHTFLVMFAFVFAGLTAGAQEFKPLDRQAMEEAVARRSHSAEKELRQLRKKLEKELELRNLKADQKEAEPSVVATTGPTGTPATTTSDQQATPAPPPQPQSSSWWETIKQATVVTVVLAAFVGLLFLAKRVVKEIFEPPIKKGIKITTTDEAVNLGELRPPQTWREKMWNGLVQRIRAAIIVMAVFAGPAWAQEALTSACTTGHATSGGRTVIGEARKELVIPARGCRRVTGIRTPDGLVEFTQLSHEDNSLKVNVMAGAGAITGAQPIILVFADTSEREAGPKTYLLVRSKGEEEVREEARAGIAELRRETRAGLDELREEFMNHLPAPLLEAPAVSANNVLTEMVSSETLGEVRTLRDEVRDLKAENEALRVQLDRVVSAFEELTTTVSQGLSQKVKKGFFSKPVKLDEAGARTALALRGTARVVPTGKEKEE